MTYFKWVDVAKGIGIICVVAGHAINQLIPENVSFLLVYLRNLLYSFHIPLFFFLSGVLLNCSINIREFTLKKIKRLVIPYFFSYILISILLFTSYVLIKTPATFSWVQYITGMLQGTLLEFMTQTGTNILNPLWFLTTLFCAMIISFFILTIISKDHVLGLLLLIVIICLGYALSIITIHLPWGFDIAMVAQSFIIPGFYFKKYGYAGSVENFFRKKSMP